ncbi:terpenoid synthase, partial [Aspergillus ellipticus CBS 707.79]
SIAPNFTIAQSFYEIGALIREGSEHVSIREFVCNTLCDYVTAAVKMENAFQGDVVQGLDEYLDNRMGSSCVQNIDIPAWFLDHPLAKEMMRHINVMVALDNDIVSAHRELHCKYVGNMVLLLVHHRGMTPQEAVDHCCQLIRDSSAAFGLLESEILNLAIQNDIVETATIFVESCKDVRIGLVNWL